MLKVVACLFLAIALFYPIGSFSGEIAVCKGGKSSGEFILANGGEISKIVDFEGVSLSLTKEQIKSFLDGYDCKKVHSYTAGGVENIYYYSKKINKKELIFGKKVNVHIAVSNGEIILGVPFIYYGY